MRILSIILFFFAMSTSSYAFKCDPAPGFRAPLIIMHDYDEDSAYWDEETNEIHLSKEFLNKHSLAVQKHIVQHECAHAHGIYNEMKADAYASKRVLLTKENVEEICNNIFNLNYRPERLRCEALRKSIKRK